MAGEIVASCRNCRYCFYEPGDIHEWKKCAVVGNSFPVNQLALELIEESDAKWDICECYQPDEMLKDRIVYKVKEWQD